METLLFSLHIMYIKAEIFCDSTVYAQHSYTSLEVVQLTFSGVRLLCIYLKRTACEEKGTDFEHYTDR